MACNYDGIFIPANNITAHVYKYDPGSDNYLVLGRVAVYATIQHIMRDYDIFVMRMDSDMSRYSDYFLMGDELDNLRGDVINEPYDVEQALDTTGYGSKIPTDTILKLMRHFNLDNIIIQRQELSTYIITREILDRECKGLRSPKRKTIWNLNDDIFGMNVDGSFGVRSINFVVGKLITITASETHDITEDPSNKAYKDMYYPKTPRWIRSSGRPVTNMFTGAEFGFTNKCDGRAFLPVSRYPSLYYDTSKVALMLEKYFFLRA